LTESIWLSTDSGEVGAMSVLINLSALLDDAKCFELDQVMLITGSRPETEP
jgi:hypothetical protein